MQPDTRSLLALAAELRAAGQTWEAVARRVGRESSTCRKWPSRYRQDWDSLYPPRQGHDPKPAAPPANPLPRRVTTHSGADAARVAGAAAVPSTHARMFPAAPAALRTPFPPIPVRPPAKPAFASPFDNGLLPAALLLVVAALSGAPAAPAPPTVTNPHAARLLFVDRLAHNQEAGIALEQIDFEAAALLGGLLTSHRLPPEMVRDAGAALEPPAAPRRTGTRRPVPDPDPDRLSDEDLLARFRRGQREVFGTLVRRYQRELYGYLRRYLGDPHLADDVFQTTFVQVFSKAGQYEPGRPVRPWLYAIATNQAIDALRRAGRHPAVSLEQTETEAEGERRGLIELLEAREADPFDNVDAAETGELVRRCIDRLPDFLRQVLLMAYYQGLKYQEIADALDIPLGTVKSRLHAAMAKLGEAWERADPQPQAE